MFSTLGIWILIASCTAVLAVRQMDTIYEWKYIDYSWTSDDHRYQAIKSGQYNYTRILPMDVDKSSRGDCSNVKLSINLLYISFNSHL